MGECHYSWSNQLNHSQSNKKDSTFARKRCWSNCKDMKCCHSSLRRSNQCRTGKCHQCRTGKCHTESCHQCRTGNCHSLKGNADYSCCHRTACCRSRLQGKPLTLTC